jgi:hypothetical protein
MDTPVQDDQCCCRLAKFDSCMAPLNTILNNKPKMLDFLGDISSRLCDARDWLMYHPKIAV